MIEFTVYHQVEGQNKIIFPKEHKLNHYFIFQIQKITLQ